MMNTTALLGDKNVLFPYFDPVRVFQAIEQIQSDTLRGGARYVHAPLRSPDAGKI